jgi:hypothetical protein
LSNAAREGFRDRLRPLDITPFEAAIAAVAVAGGIAGIMHFGVIDPLSKVLPGWLVAVFGALYLVSGLCLIVGLVKRSFQVEAAGLVFLATSLVVREIVYIAYLGAHADALVSSTFYAAFLFACWARLKTLLRGETLIRTRVEPPR